MSWSTTRRRRLAVRTVLSAVLGYALFWLLGTLGMLAASAWARTQVPPATTVDTSIGHFQQVDGHLWRGGAPDAAGYRRLAELGVRTVVDLRAEDIEDIEDIKGGADPRPEALGLNVVRIPIRDGQSPRPDQVARFLAVVRASSTPVFVHCGAGVGRTGTMSAAYLTSTHETGPRTAFLTSLAVGPPTLEQLNFMHGLRAGGAAVGPPLPVRLVSRALDLPRRLWSRLTH